ncbi:tripartite tricarboxylate transporter TctB family protein [Roseomonas sp. NAR14]|uniref:Tripartite tricarboxylate transporter TctB family protein n=1 Tax=Roseomonas acroporae TaxID=2937791 RepID=A0A9X2BXR9_9PROT|nr:tripartite tricarboxylate transporter TctB family protein [Roseomonas acroporae]MCK8786224.1 tripartite tricarboxylate transporter TctB family protein [Roseomonas acroporae]
MQLSDRVTGAVLALLGVLAIVFGARLPGVPGQEIGPSVFPMLIGAGLVLCGVLIVLGVGASFEVPEEEPASGSPAAGLPAAVVHRAVPLLRLLVPPALLLFYVLAVDRLGFLPTAALVVLAMAFTLGARARLAVPLALLAPLGVSLVFSKLLLVPLPDGILPLPW